MFVLCSPVYNTCYVGAIFFFVVINLFATGLQQCCGNNKQFNCTRVVPVVGLVMDISMDTLQGNKDQQLHQNKDNNP